MAEICARCGEERKTRDVEIAGPTPEAASYQAKLCSACATATGAKPVK
jgi:hypothetical protein